MRHSANQPPSPDNLRVALDGGKYEVVQEAGGKAYALRHGEHWRDLTGDKLVLSLAYDLVEARERIANLEEQVAYQDYIASGPEAGPTP